jgi:hypothetical protein
MVGENDFSDYKYASFERIIAFGQALNPYESVKTLRDFSAALAGDRTFTNNLHKFKAPVYVVGAGHGYGKYMKDNINLLGSHNITWNYRHKFGHADHYLSMYHRQILEYPILFWLNGLSHCRYEKATESEEIEVPLTGNTSPIMHPNPTSDIVMMSYQLPKDGKVSLFLTNVSGVKVLELIDHENQIAGKYDLSFDVSQLKPGVYLYVLQTDTAIKSGKLVITDK